MHDSLTCLVTEKTAFIGRAEKDLNCLPVENNEYRRLLEAKAREESEPRRETQLLRGTASSLGGNVLNPGTFGKVDDQFKEFIVNLPHLSPLRHHSKLIVARNPLVSRNPKAKTTRPLECRRMSFLIAYTIALGNSNIGRSGA